jgi:hypothetical protein
LVCSKRQSQGKALLNSGQHQTLKHSWPSTNNIKHPQHQAHRRTELQANHRLVCTCGARLSFLHDFVNLGMPTKRMQRVGKTLQQDVVLIASFVVGPSFHWLTTQTKTIKFTPLHLNRVKHSLHHVCCLNSEHHLSNRTWCCKRPRIYPSNVSS